MSRLNSEIDINVCSVSDLAEACHAAYRENGDDVDACYASTSLAKRRFRFWNKSEKIAKLPSGIHYAVLVPNEINNSSGEENPRPIIIVFKGTSNASDVRADLQIAIHGQAIDYQKEANALVRAIAKKYPANPIIVTGHSLGGSLAQHAVAEHLVSHPQKPDIRAVTFGAPGVTQSTRDQIRQAGNTLNFITFEHVNDPIAGLGGVSPTNIIYKVKNQDVAHGISTYIADSKEVSSARLNNLGGIALNGDLEKVHLALFKEEVERLKENDEKYAKKNAMTSKLWLASIASSMMEQAELSVFSRHLQACVVVMERRRFMNTVSSKNIPEIKLDDQDFVCNLPEIIKSLRAEITRMEKDDFRYSRPGYETLKLALCKSLQNKLLSVEAGNKSPIDSSELKKMLHGVLGLQRDENYLSIQKHAWIANKLSLVLEGEEGNHVYNRLMRDIHNNWIKPKSAKNIPEVKGIDESSIKEIRSALSKEIERMSENDFKYAKPGNITLKRMLFELLDEALEDKFDQFSVKELQSILNVIYSMNRSSDYPSVAKNIGQLNMKSGMDAARVYPKMDLKFFWNNLSKREADKKKEDSTSCNNFT